MKNSKYFCGIFATVFVTTTMVLLASCSQDDDYYESDMYTLAEMGTRLGDPEPGGGEASVVYSSYNLVADAGEHWIPFFRQGIPSGEYLQIHLYALADSAFAQWGGYTKAMNKKVSVSSTTADTVSTDSLNVNLMFHIEVHYKGDDWSSWTSHSIPKSSFFTH